MFFASMHVHCACNSVKIEKEREREKTRRSVGERKWREKAGRKGGIEI